MTDAPFVSGLRIAREDMSLLIRGAAIDVAPHRHHALQIAVGLAGPFRLEQGQMSAMFDGAIVAPDTAHRLDSLGQDIGVLLVEPELPAAREAGLRFLGGRPVAALPGAETERLRAICMAGELPSPVEALAVLVPGAEKRQALDPRIAALQERLRALPEKRAVPGEAAAALGLSESHLRHLFRKETGVSFRRYLLWLRLGDAMARALSGTPLTEAAHAAGFADSAHLSRTCREMFGINPLALARHSRFVQAPNGAGS